MTPSFPTRRSSDLHAVVIGRRHRRVAVVGDHRAGLGNDLKAVEGLDEAEVLAGNGDWPRHLDEALLGQIEARKALARPVGVDHRSEEHPSELQYLMRIP